jgi:MFS family permease
MYFLTIFNNGWFINANWIFLALSLMNKSVLGLVDSGSLLIGTLVDLPSGAVADIIGRRKTIIVSRFVFLIGCVLFIFAYNVWTFTIANILFFIGLSFYGGADQALLYDSLIEHNKEKHYITISTRIDLISRISTFIASLIGAAAFALNIRMPFVLLAIFAAIALCMSFFLEETTVIEKRDFNLHEFITQQSEGIKVLTGNQLRMYLPVLLVIIGTLIIFNWGILRGFVALEYGFNGSEQSIIFGALTFIVGLAGLLLPHLISKSSDYSVTLLFSALSAAGFLMSGLFLTNKLWGLLLLLIISIAGGLVNTMSLKIVNDEVSSRYRATALSALSIVTKIPYIMTAFLIGSMADANRLTDVTRAIAIISFIAIIATILMKWRKVTLVTENNL